MNQRRHRGCGCYQERQSRWVEPSILYLLCEKSRHGYELMQALPNFGFMPGPADTGAIYRTLRHLEAVGLVSSTWDTSAVGPARRQYTITELGRQHLRLWTNALKQRREALDEFLKKLESTVA
ncbi:helix-turn-helix transcriptional regulator [candidate division KSB1 bacterium]|nr:helix-turn-helix transcriptional regulator [candidate division KSB1 bacterium]